MLGKKIIINAPARLHFGFGKSGEGTVKSVGLAVEGFGELKISLCAAEADRIVAPPSVKAVIADYLKKWRRLFAKPSETAVEITVTSHPPPHSGLGSGTQLAMSMIHGLGRLNGIKIDPETAASKMGRLKRSVVGLNAWLGGGFIIGNRKNCHRYRLPKAWRILLLTDDRLEGLSGRNEERAFIELSHRLCGGPQSAEIVERRLPAAVHSGDFPAFADAVTDLQKAMAQLFADFQGGAFSSPRIAEAVKLLPRPGVGQSSWGPTAFALFADQKTAENYRRVVGRNSSLKPVIVRPNDSGAIIKSLE